MKAPVKAARSASSLSGLRGHPSIRARHAVLHTISASSSITISFGFIALCLLVLSESLFRVFDPALGVCHMYKAFEVTLGHSEQPIKTSVKSPIKTPNPNRAKRLVYGSLFESSLMSASGCSSSLGLSYVTKSGCVEMRYFWRHMGNINHTRNRAVYSSNSILLGDFRYFSLSSGSACRYMK